MTSIAEPLAERQVVRDVHEQGMRFSWRVMLRAKGGSTTFIVKNPESGKVWHVSPRTYLTGIQESEMSGQPDLILQLAHHVKEDFELRGLGPVEVRTELRVGLNGRRSAIHDRSQRRPCSGQ